MARCWRWSARPEDGWSPAPPTPPGSTCSTAGRAWRGAHAVTRCSPVVTRSERSSGTGTSDRTPTRRADGRRGGGCATMTRPGSHPSPGSPTGGRSPSPRGSGSRCTSTMSLQATIEAAPGPGDGGVGGRPRVRGPGRPCAVALATETWQRLATTPIYGGGTVLIADPQRPRFALSDGPETMAVLEYDLEVVAAARWRGGAVRRRQDRPRRRLGRREDDPRPPPGDRRVPGPPVDPWPAVLVPPLHRRGKGRPGHLRGRPLGPRRATRLPARPLVVHRRRRPRPARLRPDPRPRPAGRPAVLVTGPPPGRWRRRPHLAGRVEGRRGPRRAARRGSRRLRPPAQRSSGHPS